MKRSNFLLKISAFIFLPATILVWCCTKPTEDIEITVTPDIITHTVALQFSDASQTDQIPDGLAVSLEGDDADAMYDYSGTKTLKLIDGMLTIGVTPSRNPTQDVLSFTVRASADNYLPVNVPVRIGVTNKNQHIEVPMINLRSTPAGVAVVQPVASISNGVATTPVTATTTATANTTTTVGITVPSGTQFKDATGRIINGSSVQLTVAAFDPAQPAAMQSLPGGQVQHTVNGGSSPNVFFLPAGFATINMRVGNTDVKQFSTPASVSVGLNSTMFNPLTGSAIQAGDVVDVYSHEIATGNWTYEKAVTVRKEGNRLVANFETSHLSSFLANVRSNINPCTGSPLLVFNAPRISSGSSDQFILDIYPTGTGERPAPVLSQYLTLHDKDSLYLQALPAGNVLIRVFRVDYDHYLLNDYKNRGVQVAALTANLCGAGSNATVVQVDDTPGSYLTGTGVAICPNDNTRRFLAPNGAQIYYKKSRTDDSYRILGVVVNNAISSTQLKVGQRYDFMGNYGGRQIGKLDYLIESGRSFLDSAYVIQHGFGVCD